VLLISGLPKSYLTDLSTPWSIIFPIIFPGELIINIGCDRRLQVRDRPK
jgi:hypothetical protein